MKYTTYFEQKEEVDKSEGAALKEVITNENMNLQVEQVAIKKLRYEKIMTGESEIHYSICMKNNDTNEIYLQRKTIQSNTTYKTIAHITKEQCEKIFSGDYQWLIEKKISLYNDFYLQVTLNQLKMTNIIEIEKEVYSVKNDYISFISSFFSTSCSSNHFFFQEGYMICCLDENKVLVSIKKAVTIPRYISNMVHMVNDRSYLSKLAYIL